MHLIIPKLYISSWNHLQESSIVQDNDEWFIINCTKNLPYLISEHRCIRIPVDDDLTTTSLQDLLDSFSSVLEIINNKLENNINVIVHCAAGQQRSPTVVCAYLMAYCNMSLAESILFIKDRKADAFFWKANFLPCLETFARQLNKDLNDLKINSI